MKYTENKLRQIFARSVQMFNQNMDEHYSVDDGGIMLRFFTPENGANVYEDFCRTYFPDYLKENYKPRKRYEEMSAEAFVSEEYDGVIMRSDLDLPEYEIIHIYLHELAHLFCTRNEIEGGKFYNQYCDVPDHPIYGENVNRRMNGYICAGYQVWREAIAEIISIEIMFDICDLHDTDDEVKRLYDLMYYGNPNVKREASSIIAYVMLANPDIIKERYPYFNQSMVRLLNGIRNKLNEQPFFIITPEFIAQLGSTYLMALSEKETNSYGF